MQALINVILPVFVVIGAGYLLTWRRYVSEVTIDALMRYAQSVAIPCLLFLALARMDLGAAISPGLLAAFYAGALASFGLGILGARLLTGRDWEDCVAIGFCCLFSNTVLIGLPIVERAFGPEALVGSYAIIAFHAPFCYGLGITVMEAVSHRDDPPGTFLRSVLRAMFSNALVLAILAGAAVNLAGLALPGALTEGLDLVAQSALPTALFALGGILTRYRPEGDARAIALVCLLALVVHPVITWTLGRAFGVPDDLFRAAVITAAMAPGMNAFLFANMYGRAKRVAASSILIATGGSIFSAWLWLLLLA